MVIYEVNLYIEAQIFPDYERWLKKHIEEMLRIEGFLEAKVMSDSEKITSDEKVLVVQYLLTSMSDLKNYFDNDASKMRQKSVDKFGNRFRAERRVLELQDHYRKN